MEMVLDKFHMEGFVETAGGDVNYRQVGRLKPGSIKHAGDSFEYAPVANHPTMKLRLKKTIPSIPTKFATSIHVGQRERNAFGARVNRFGQFDTEVPGAGSYYTPGTLLKDPTSNTSVSKLGYGVGFVSKTDRFSDKPYRQARVAPAPGQYLSSSVPTILVKTSHSKAPVTSVFVKPRKWRDDPTLPPSQTPGPAEYDPAVLVSKPLGHRKVSTQPRLGGPPPSDVPPPGAYETALSMRPAPGLSSNFKSSVARFEAAPPVVEGPIVPSVIRALSGTQSFITNALSGGVKAHKTIADPLAAASAAVSTGLLPPTLEDRPGPSRILGPGVYDITPLPAKVDMVTTTSLFGNASTLDRWGQPVQKRSAAAKPVPGPGAYDPSVKGTEVGAAAQFKSVVPRGFEPPEPIPGPSFYKPALPEKKSFQLNSLNRWVT